MYRRGRDPTDNQYSLQIYKCKFVQNHAKSDGGAIFISINGETSPHRPINIYDNIFISNKAEEKDNQSGTSKEEEEEHGGAIYYSFASSGTIAQGSKSLRVNKCRFEENKVSHEGGCLYISITKDQPTNSIEITECHFYNNKAENSVESSQGEASLGSGSDIYYNFESTDTSSSSAGTNDEASLLVYKCYFSGSEAISEGGNIRISILKGEPLKSIEIKNCTFKGNKASKGGSISYNYESNPQQGTINDNIYALHITDCKFNSNTATVKGSSIFLSISSNAPNNAIKIAKNRWLNILINKKP